MITNEKPQLLSGASSRSLKWKPIVASFVIASVVVLLHFVLALNPYATDVKSYYMPAVLLFAGIGIAVSPFIWFVITAALWLWADIDDAATESNNTRETKDRKMLTTFLVIFARFGGWITFTGSLIYGIIQLESGGYEHGERTLVGVLGLASIAWMLIGIFGWLGFGMVLNGCGFLASLFLTDGMPDLDSLGSTTDTGWAAVQVGVIYAMALFVSIGVLIRNIRAKSKAKAQKTTGDQS